MAFRKNKKGDQVGDASLPDASREILVSIGERIAEARLEAGMTTAELAARVGVSEIILERFETGVQDPTRVLGALAQATGKSLAWFLADREESPAVPEGPVPIVVEEQAPVTPLPAPAAAAAQEPSHPVPAAEPPAPPEEAPVEEPSRADARLEAVPEPVASIEHAAPPPRSAERSEEAAEEDALEELMDSISRQAKRLHHRRSSLDERERSLDEREAALGAHARDVEQFRSLLQQLESKLEHFERTNRASAEAASAFSDWARSARDRLDPAAASFSHDR
jgi:transcriptional regulator with XRE-family HTH domain